MSGHTPTPWKLTHKIDPTAVSAVTATGQFEAVIANCGGWSSNCNDPEAQRDEQVANAEFIVRAVNAHDALVKQLSLVRKFYAAMGYVEVADIDDALALARGEAVPNAR